MNIKDRIVEFKRVPAASVRPNPRNWRTHPDSQRNAMRGVLAEVGIVDALLARRLGDGTLELIDGHLRAEVLESAEVPVLILDVNEREADYILTTFDPLTALATADTGNLDALLRNISSANPAVQQMLSDLAAGVGLYPDAIEDGAGDEVHDAAGDPLADVLFRFGPYEFRVERDAFDRWESELTRKVGPAVDAGCKEIRKRLRIA